MVLPQHPHIQGSMWDGHMYHQSAYADHLRHISVDSDPHGRPQSGALRVVYEPASGHIEVFAAILS